MIKEEIALKYFNFSVFLHFIGRLLYRTFVPMILLELGYSINDILLYILIYSISTIIFYLFSNKFLSKKNIIYFYICAIISELILIILLVPEKINYIFLLIIGLMEGIYYTYYYLSYNAIILHYTSHKKTSNNLGNTQIVGSIANILTPVIGSVLLIFDKNLFIFVAAIFLIFSILPLLKIIKTDINGINFPKISIKNIKFELFSVFVRSGLEISVFILWSIYIYISGFSLIYVGLIPAIDAFINILILYSVKKKLKNINIRQKLKIISIIGIIISSLFRYIFPEKVIISNLIISIFYTIFSLAITTDFFEKSKNFQTYYSSTILGITGFSAWILIILMVFIIGLKNSILIPLFLGVIWMIIKFLKKDKIVKKYMN